MGNLFALLSFALAYLVATTEGLSFENAYIQNVESGRCITIDKDAILNPLYTAKCNCGAYQFWKTEDEFVVNELAWHGYMDEFYGKPNNGETVGIYDKTTLPWQKWRIHELDDGTYNFIVKHTGKCLHQGSSGKVDQWDCNDKEASQQWKIIQNPCGSPPKMPGRFQLENPSSGMCAVVMGNSNLHYAKISLEKCSCENTYHYWKYNKMTLVSEGLTKQCMANWEPQGFPGVTQCTCTFTPTHRYRFAPLDNEGNFNIQTQVDGRCVYTNGGSESTTLQFKNCDREDEQQKWRFYDACHPEPKPTPKPTPPPVTPTPPPTPTNEIPTHLQFFFESGMMNWLNPTRYTLLIGGRWDAATNAWITVDGRRISPNTELWKIYFGDVKPSFLNMLFANGKSFNEAFSWMSLDFFEIWTSWKVAPKPPPQSKDTIPPTQTSYFASGQLNWLTPERYSLLQGGSWDPVTVTWTTVYGQKITPDSSLWTVYFGDAKPQFLNVIFQNTRTWNDTFGWMTPNFFQRWTAWKVVTPPPQQKDEIPSRQVTLFTNGQMKWLTPERYTLLVGGRWDSATSTWHTASGKQIQPSSPEWSIYFGTLPPSHMNLLFSSGNGSWDAAFGWMTPNFFNVWTGWQQVTVHRKIQIVMPANVPTATRQLFSSGQLNWLTPDRVRMLAGGTWSGNEYVTKTYEVVTPGTPTWKAYFGSADTNSVNALLGGPGAWDNTMSWLTEAVQAVPSGQSGDSFPWNSVFGKEV